jgi:hypothetical protein
MRVSAVCAEDVVALFEGAANTYGDTFLSDAEVHGATHFLFGITIGDAFFDHADTQHAREEGETRLDSEVIGDDGGLIHFN